MTSSETEKQAICVAAENTAGVHAVYDHLVKGSHFGGAEFGSSSPGSTAARPQGAGCF
jgi:hypothetical protein